MQSNNTPLHAGLFVICMLCLGSVAIENELQVRQDLISLVEDDLAGAFTFTPDSDELLPNFERLDQLYPDWHKGDPAAGRRAWLAQRYKMHLVDYRVDMVDILDEFGAKVRGKKLVAWTTDPASPVLDNVWPFQLWNQIKACKKPTATCKYVVYSIDYELKLEKVEDVGWVIAKEKTSKIPDAGEKVNCSFARALGDWRASGSDWSFGKRRKCPETAEPALQERTDDSVSVEADGADSQGSADAESGGDCTNGCD